MARGLPAAADPSRRSGNLPSQTCAAIYNVRAMDRFYVTTPIYYVNDKPHIGHAYTTILADVLARYHRLRGDDTFFLTGTDEHGLKVQQAAEKAGISPQEQADRTVIRFQDLWKKIEITHDDFIRTTEPRHKLVVQEILQDLYDRGEIYRAEYDGWYDVASETFVTEKELEALGGPGAPNITRIKESNYFFRMGAYQKWLIEYIESNPRFIQPDFRRNETLGFLRRPLNDLCISRPKRRLAWGIELPFDRDFVTYVWFDALINYISAVGYRRDEAAFGRRWPASVHLIGKDILTTHTVYWPTMLKAMGIPLPECVFAHGWWLSGASKMSKSLGNVVDPMDLIDKYGVDPFRYFLIAEMTLGQDASFSEEAFVRRYNSDLANDLGNLLSRILTMIRKNCEGKLPSPAPDVLTRPAEAALWNKVQETAGAMLAAVESMRLDQGISEVLDGIRSVNRYLEETKPWNLARQGDKQPLHSVLYSAAEALRVAAGLLYPVMPERMADLRAALGLSREAPNLATLREWGILRAGVGVAESAPLFPRITAEKEDKTTVTSEAEPKAVPPAPAAAPEKTVELLDYDEFARMQLRTAEIIEAEKVPGTDKLMRLTVRMGAEKRQLVAGIALHYEPQEVVGKTVIVVANLKPAVIRGVESNGMVLAASRGETLRLLTVDDSISTGAVVK